MYVETIKSKDIQELGRLRDITQEYDILSDRYTKAIDRIYRILTKADEEGNGADVCICE